MAHKKQNIVSALACAVFMLAIPPAIVLELNESNLWYGYRANDDLQGC